MTVSQPHPSSPSYRPFEVQPIFQLLPPGKSAEVPPFAPGTPWFPLHHMKCGFLIAKDPWPVLPPISFFRLSPWYQGPSYDHLIDIWQWRKVVVPIFLLLFTVRFSFWMISAVWGWAWWFMPVILALGRETRTAGIQGQPWPATQWALRFKMSVGYMRSGHKTKLFYFNQLGTMTQPLDTIISQINTCKSWWVPVISLGSQS